MVGIATFDGGPEEVSRGIIYGLEFFNRDVRYARVRARASRIDRVSRSRS